MECVFVDDDIIHNMGSIDSIRDIEVINTELILSDISSLESQREKLARKHEVETRKQPKT